MLTYTTGNKPSRNRRTPVRHDADEIGRHGRVHPQRLVQHRQHVRQPVHGRDIDLLRALERTPHLPLQPLQRLGMRQQQVRRAGERRGRRLRPGQDQDKRIARELLEIQPPLVPPLHETLEEIVLPPFLHGQPLLQHGARELARLDQVLAAAHGPEEELHDPVQAQVAEDGHAHAPPHRREDEFDPRVVVRALQAVEGLAEYEAARDVEGRPVVPRFGVEGLDRASGGGGGGGFGVQAVD